VRRVALALAVLVAAAISCVGGGRIGGGSIGRGGGGNGGGEQNPAVTPGSQALPALPTAHGGSTIPEAWIFGKDACDCSPGSAVEGTALRLEIVSPPYPGWAMYRFSLTHALGSLSVRLEAPEGGAYVGLSDYAKGGWEFNGPYSADAVILPHDGKRYESPAGEVYCLVMAAGKAVTVEQVIASTVFGEPVVVCSEESQFLGPVALAVVNGNPAICYDTSSYGNYSDGAVVRYLRALDPDGTAWAEPVEAYRWDLWGGIHPGAEVMRLAEVNGKPAIGFSAGYWTLGYLGALDGLGSTWAMPVVVDTVAEGLYYPSLAVVDGRPAFSYVAYLPYPPISRELRFLRALDADGIAWGAPTAVDRDRYLSEWTSLAVINGKPAITYMTSYPAMGGDFVGLVYMRASDAAGSSWTTPSVLADGGKEGNWSGESSSLALVNGNPAIAYRGALQSRDGYNVRALYYVRALDAGGSAWGTPVALDPDPNLGLAVSLTVVGGNPAVAYSTAHYEAGHPEHDYRFVRALDANGSAWGAPVIVNGAGTGWDRALVAVNGKPAVVYCGGHAVYYLRSF